MGDLLSRVSLCIHDNNGICTQSYQPAVVEKLQNILVQFLFEQMNKQCFSHLFHKLWLTFSLQIAQQG